MTRAEYEAIDAVNWSVLKHMQRSPAHYAYAKANDTQPRTDAMILGTVTHFAVFEPQKIETHVAVWSGRRAGKEWDKFEAENAHKEIIKDEAMLVALQLGAAARKAAGKLLSEGESEVTLEWTHKNGLRGKGRLDHISRGYGVIDLKTCRDASPLGFGRSAANLGYICQASYYVDAAEACGFGVLPYTILAVESRPPFAATLYTVTPDHLELGRSIYLPLLDQVKACRASGEWPSYPPSVLTLPKWATAEAENDITGMGLVFGEDES